MLAADFNAMVQRQVVATFANAAARNAALPSPAIGMVCALTDIRALQMYDGTTWVEPGKTVQTTISAQHANISGATIVAGSNFTLPSRLRRYSVDLMFQIFKGGAAGNVTLVPGGTGISAQTIFASMVSPETRTLTGHWSFSGAGITGGVITAASSAGTLNVEAGSLITVTDAGSI